MFSFTSSGSFEKTKLYLKRLLSGDMFRELDKYGRDGVDALARATPVDSGLTADSWGYHIVQSESGPTIEWYNTNVNTGANVAILIQYGHGTGTGGYVLGIDYINPAMRPIFDRILDDIRKEVRR